MKRKKTEISNGAKGSVKQKKRHSIPSVIFIALILTFVGSIFGGVLSAIVQVSILDLSEAVSFVMNTYFPFIGLVILLLGYCFIKEKEIFKSMGSAGKGGLQGNTFKMLVFGLVLGFASNGACILVAWLNKDLSFFLQDISPTYFVFAFVCVLIQSGAEELLSRGYMQGALMERYGIKTAILVNGLFFGLMHIPNDGMTVLAIMNVTLYGVVMSMVTYHFRSLWFCVAHHTAWNFTQNFIFGLPNSGFAAEESLLELTGSRQSILYDVQFGVEGGVVVCIFGLITTTVLIMRSKKNIER